MATGPSRVTKENGAASSSTLIAAYPARRRLRPFTVVSPVLNTIVPSSSTAYQIGATWGRPSAHACPGSPDGRAARSGRRAPRPRSSGGTAPPEPRGAGSRRWRADRGNARRRSCVVRTMSLTSRIFFVLLVVGVMATPSMAAAAEVPPTARTWTVEDLRIPARERLSIGFHPDVEHAELTATGSAYEVCQALMDGIAGGAPGQSWPSYTGFDGVPPVRRRGAGAPAECRRADVPRCVPRPRDRRRGGAVLAVPGAVRARRRLLRVRGAHTHGLVLGRPRRGTYRRCRAGRSERLRGTR